MKRLMSQSRQLIPPFCLQTRTYPPNDFLISHSNDAHEGILQVVEIDFYFPIRIQSAPQILQPDALFRPNSRPISNKLRLEEKSISWKG